MFYLSLLAFFLLVFVVGEVLGLLAQCETSKHLRAARAFVWYVPLMQLYLLVNIVMDGFRDRDFGMLAAFFRYGESGIIILGCISNQVATMKVKAKPVQKLTWPHFCQAADSVLIALEATA